jgi:hypothetical protein
MLNFKKILFLHFPADNTQIDRLLIKEKFNPWYHKSVIHGTSIDAAAAEVFEVVKQTIRL